MIETLGYWYQRLIAGPFTRGRVKRIDEAFRASLVTATIPPGYYATHESLSQPSQHGPN